MPIVRVITKSGNVVRSRNLSEEALRELHYADALVDESATLIIDGERMLTAVPVRSIDYIEVVN